VGERAGTCRGMSISAVAYEAYMFSAVLPAGAIFFLYHPLLEVLMSGRTPGKRIAGVRIVAEDGRVPGAGALLIRNVLRLVDSLPLAYVLGLTATVVTRNAVRLGDLAAGTILVYDNETTGGAAAVLRRDHRAMSGHGVERLELARELLERWDELAPEVRLRLGRRLLSEFGDASAGDLSEPRLRHTLRMRLRGLQS